MIEVTRILSEAGHTGPDSRYPLIELREPEKQVVLDWQEGDPEPRAAVVNVVT
jgi:primary-amine oxidase